MITAVTAWICRTCANQHRATPDPPSSCRVCTDDRQYVPDGGQAWTSLAELAAEGHTTSWRELEPGLHELSVTPRLGIGHRGLLVSTPAGGVLWDPPGYLDDEALALVVERGGLVAVARSHPHLFGAAVEWSRRAPRADGAPGHVPIWLPRRDAGWVLRSSSAVTWWDDAADVAPGVRLVRCGGHFAGSAVLHVAAAAGGRGALLVGDTLMVLPGRRRVSFMRSYPMLLPLPERYLDRLLGALAPLRYDSLHGGWPGSVVATGAERVVAESAALYRAWLTGSATDADQDGDGDADPAREPAGANGAGRRTGGG